MEQVKFFFAHEFILYNDKIVLFLLMGGRRKIKPWDPSILGDGRFTKGATVFGYL